MTKEEIYQRRLPDVKPLVFAIQEAIELYGREEAKTFAQRLLDRYAYDRFVEYYKNVPPEERWAKFLSDHLEWADGIQFSVTAHDKTMVKVAYHWCSFLEIFKDHGLADFVPLYCNTDFRTCREIHPGITLTRTKTLADGADCCDHCWTYQPE